MPRAENRKKPANLMGNPRGQGLANGRDNASANQARQAQQTKKDALLEKMKQVQAKKKQTEI